MYGLKTAVGYVFYNGLTTRTPVLHSEKQFSGRHQLRVDQGGRAIVVSHLPSGAAHGALYMIKLSGTV